MVNVAAATKRLDRRTRRAVHNIHRRRRLSHRALPALFQTHRVPEGGVVDAGDVFLDENLEVTFAGLVRREAAGPDSFLTIGTLLELGTTAGGGLSIRVGSFSAVTSLSVEIGRTFRFALAIRPGDAQVRIWVDSDRVLAAQFGTSTLAWHDDGDLTFTDVPSATMLDDLDVYYIQRPRQFGDANLILTDPGAVNDLLLRAAKATFKLGRWPFMENPNI